MSHSQAFGKGVEEATFGTPGKGRQGIGVYGQCCRGCCGDGGKVGLTLFLSLLVLLTVGLEQMAMGEHGPV